MCNYNIRHSENTRYHTGRFVSACKKYITLIVIA